MASVEKIIVRGAELRLKNGIIGLLFLVGIGSVMTLLGGDGGASIVRNIGGFAILYLTIQGLFTAPIQFRLSALFGLTRTMQFVVEVVLSLLDVVVLVTFNYILYRLGEVGFSLTSFTYEDGLVSWVNWLLAGLVLHLMSNCLGILFNKFPWKKALMTYGFLLMAIAGGVVLLSALGMSEEHVLAMFQWLTPLVEAVTAYEVAVLGALVVVLLGALYGLMRRHESLPFGQV